MATLLASFEGRHELEIHQLLRLPEQLFEQCLVRDSCFASLVSTPNRQPVSLSKPLFSMNLSAVRSATCCKRAKQLYWKFSLCPRALRR